MLKRLKNKELKIEQVKYNGRKVGCIIHWLDGRKLYLHYRTMREMWRGEFSGINEAISNDAAAWGLETIMIARLTRLKIDVVGIYITGTKDYYVTTLANFTDPDKVLKKIKSTPRLGVQKLLPLSFFHLKRGKVMI